MGTAAVFLATTVAVLVETAENHAELGECGEQGAARAARIWLEN